MEQHKRFCNWKYYGRSKTLWSTRLGISIENLTFSETQQQYTVDQSKQNISYYVSYMHLTECTISSKILSYLHQLCS